MLSSEPGGGVSWCKGVELHGDPALQAPSWAKTLRDFRLLTLAEIAEWRDSGHGECSYSSGRSRWGHEGAAGQRQLQRQPRRYAFGGDPVWTTPPSLGASGLQGGATERSTRTVDNNRTPVWNERFNFPCSTDSSLYVDVFDDDGADTTDDYLGHTR